MKIEALNTKEGFTAFIQSYHQVLEKNLSFPRLGLQKALHAASPVFGFKNWNALSASDKWNAPEPSTGNIHFLEFDHSKNDFCDPSQMGHVSLNNAKVATFAFSSIDKMESYLWEFTKELLKAWLLSGDHFEALSESFNAFKEKYRGYKPYQPCLMKRLLEEAQKIDIAKHPDRFHEIRAIVNEEPLESDLQALIEFEFKGSDKELLMDCAPIIQCFTGIEVGWYPKSLSLNPETPSFQGL